MEQAKGKALHAMQNLSMLLRQKRGGPEERHAYVQESLTLAKDVSCDACTFNIYLAIEQELFDRPSLSTHAGPFAAPLQALKLDLKNGHSWYIVGNAYLALFFGVAQSKEYLQQVKAMRLVPEITKCPLSNPQLKCIISSHPPPSLVTSSLGIHRIRKGRQRPERGRKQC